MGIKEINFFLSDVSDSSELIPLFVGWLFRTRKPPHNMWVWFFSVSATLKLCTLILAKQKVNNMPLFHLLALWEVSALYIFYNRVLFSKIFWLGLSVIVSLNLMNTILLEGIYQFNALSWSLNTFISLCFGLWTFKRLYQVLEFIVPEKNPTFIINSGWMIYFSGALFTYILGWEILSSEAKDLFHNSWIIESISNILKNLVVAYGLWIATRN